MLRASRKMQRHHQCERAVEMGAGPYREIGDFDGIDEAQRKVIGQRRASRGPSRRLWVAGAQQRQFRLEP
ncbi:hypothetical protein D3C85_1845310 [compost metagenome]